MQTCIYSEAIFLKAIQYCRKVIITFRLVLPVDYDVVRKIPGTLDFWMYVQLPWLSTYLAYTFFFQFVLWLLLR